MVHRRNNRGNAMRCETSFTGVDFQELCAARRAQFIAGECAEWSYRQFLIRNGFTAHDIQEEIRDAKAAKNPRHPLKEGVYA